MSNRAKCIANDIDTCIPAIPTWVLITGTVGADTVLAAQRTYFRKCVILGVKSLAGTANATPVNIGTQTPNGGPKAIAPSGEWVLEPPLGEKWDLSNFILKITTLGDGVVLFYS